MVAILGSVWTFVRGSFFHQILSTTHAADIRDRDEIIVPAGNGATAFVDAEDVGVVAATALLDPTAHGMKAWTVTCPRALTYHQIADILTTELSRPIRYAHPRPSEVRSPCPRQPRDAVGDGRGHPAIYTTARLGLAAGLTADVKAVRTRPDRLHRIRPSAAPGLD